jgi:hypothetical protein
MSTSALSPTTGSTSTTVISLQREAAQVGFEQRTLPPPKLVGAQIPDCKTRLIDARRLLAEAEMADAPLQEGKYQRIRDLFNEIQGILKVEPKSLQSLWHVECSIGLAFSYPNDSSKTIPLINQARLALDKLYEGSEKWIPAAHQREIYAKFSQLYEDLEFLFSCIPKIDSTIIPAIQEKIRLCSSLLTSLTSPTTSIQTHNLKQRYEEAQKLFQAGSLEAAGQLYYSLFTYLAANSHTNLLMPAHCALRMAFCFPQGPLKDFWIKEAKTQIDALYKTKWGAYTLDQQMTTYEWLQNSYQDLLPLTIRPLPRADILDKIEECKVKLQTLQSAKTRETKSKTPKMTASASAKPAALPTDQREVSKNPVGKSLNLTRIFAMAIVSLAAFLASVVIYRRFYVNK